MRTEIITRGIKLVICLSEIIKLSSIDFRFSKASVDVVWVEKFTLSSNNLSVKIFLISLNIFLISVISILVLFAIRDNLFF